MPKKSQHAALILSNPGLSAAPSMFEKMTLQFSASPEVEESRANTKTGGGTSLEQYEFKIGYPEIDYLVSAYVQLKDSRFRYSDAYWEALAIHPELLKDEFTRPDSDSIIRQALDKIATFPTQKVQLMLRESQSDNLVWSLWFLGNTDVEKIIFDSMSTLAAEMFRDDLQNTLAQYGPPDQARESTLLRARVACIEQLGILKDIETIAISRTQA